jgi:predicted metal-dependent phosphoesterase TrpH
MKAIAITDHDTINGVKEAQEAAKGRIQVIPGVEIGCDEKEMGLKEIHILGLFFNPDAKPINDFLEKSKKERIKQKKKMIKKLQEFGFDISFKEIKTIAKGEPGRPHIAEILLKKYPNQFSSMEDVFQKYINKDAPGYLDREHINSVKNCINAIIQSGGVAVLAHPAVFKPEDMLRLIDYFVECRGQGLETYYPYSKLYAHEGFDKQKEQKTIAQLQQIAKQKQLFETGGSDFHSSDRNTAINEMQLPGSILDSIKP